MIPKLEVDVLMEEQDKRTSKDVSSNNIWNQDSDPIGLEAEENDDSTKTRTLYQSHKKRNFSQFPRQYSKEIDQTPAVYRHNQLEFDIDEEVSNTLKEPVVKFHRMSSHDIKYQDSKLPDDYPDIDITSALLFDHKVSSKPSEIQEQQLPLASISNKEAIQELLQADLGEDDYDLIPDFEHLELTHSIGQKRPE